MPVMVLGARTLFPKPATAVIILDIMLMVIFGAGASYDSSATLSLPEYPQLEDRPPLANDLFHSRGQFATIAQSYPPLLAIIEKLRGLGSMSVETKLQQLRDEAALYPERHRQLAAVKFYLRDVLEMCSREWQRRTMGATNFGPLLDDIRKWHAHKGSQEPVCFVTFNYDLLLEYALLNAGCGFHTQQLGDYLGSSSSIFRLFKLHGSVDWVRCTDKYTAEGIEIGPHEIINQAAQLRTTDEFILYGGNRATQFHGRWLMPAIAIPVQVKDDFECPKEHVKCLESLIPAVTEILVVGWRGRETNLLNRLRQGLGAVRTLMVVDRNSHDASIVAEALKGELKTPLASTTIRVGEQGFSHFIRSGESEAFFEEN